MGAIDDRQWVATDETAPQTTSGNVYISFNVDTLPTPTIAMARSQKDGALGSFVTDSSCTVLTGGTTITTPPTGTPHCVQTPVIRNST